MSKMRVKWVRNIKMNATRYVEWIKVQISKIRWKKWLLMILISEMIRKDKINIFTDDNDD